MKQLIDENGNVIKGHVRNVGGGISVSKSPEYIKYKQDLKVQEDIQSLKNQLSSIEALLLKLTNREENASRNPL